MTDRFLGLRTVLYPAPDLEKAKAFYTALLGRPPYFDQPFYVGFNVGGYELGLDPNASRPAGDAGATAYWGVPDIARAWQEALSCGATALSEPHEVGDGIKVAEVRDPFGNAIGLIENPHFPNRA